MLEVVFEGIFDPELDPNPSDGCGCCICAPETQGAGSETAKHTA